MKNTVFAVITGVVVVVLAAFSLTLGYVSLSQTQLDTLLILGCVCCGAALYCFVVGEISRNNSQMDKLWSITPIVYAWIIAAKGQMKPRLVLFAILVTLWGIRLTANFARKGAYSLKFWAGEEDYRWKILRQKGAFQNCFVWGVFDFFFISIYQNALVLAICLPALAVMDSNAPLGALDYVAVATSFGFLMLETIADEQQMAFHTTKKLLLREGKKLEDLPAPFNKGFNTVGLWARARHPNYLGEQGFWLCLYLFVIGAGVARNGIFHFTMVGPLLLVLLFLGSSTLGESISSSKYPEYKDYVSKVCRYFPLWKYVPRSKESE